MEAESQGNRIAVVDIGDQDISVVVDTVTEVLRIPTDSIEPPASGISTADSNYLLGLAKLDSVEGALSEGELTA